MNGVSIYLRQNLQLTSEAKSLLMQRHNNTLADVFMFGLIEQQFKKNFMKYSVGRCDVIKKKMLHPSYFAVFGQCSQSRKVLI